MLGSKGAPGLVVSATRVRTGEARLFRDAEVTADVLLASACLPQLFPAVESKASPTGMGDPRATRRSDR